jgi:hypothetical protein
MTDVLARKVIQCRAGPDEIEGTEDDEVFIQPADIVKTLNKKHTLTSGETIQINNLVSTNAIGVRSNYFRAVISGYFGGANSDENAIKNSRKIICIISRNGKILFWQE